MVFFFFLNRHRIRKEIRCTYIFTYRLLNKFYKKDSHPDLPKNYMTFERDMTLKISAELFKHSNELFFFSLSLSPFPR